MGNLHDTMLADSVRLCRNLAIELVTRKLKHAGVTLTDEERFRLEQALESGELDQFALDRDTDATVEITSDDLAVLDRQWQQVLAAYTESLPEAMHETAGELLTTLVERWPERAAYEGEQRRQFQGGVEEKWSKPLNHLALLVTVCREAGDAASRREPEHADSRPATKTVLRRLHARACRTAEEVMVLLRSGFADGAIARWRTLHELAVVAMFISGGTDDTAERYAAYHVVESWFALNQYTNHQERLGLSPLAPSDLENATSQLQQVRDKYGPDFTRLYGWAAEALGNKRKITFEDLEIAVGLQHLRPYYRLASHNVHSNPLGVFFQLGLLPERNLLLAGASSSGLADPGQLCAISLTQITAALGQLPGVTIDEMVQVDVARRLCDLVLESFAEVETASRVLRADARADGETNRGGHVDPPVS